MPNLLESNIQNLEKAKYYGRQIKLVYSMYTPKIETLSEHVASQKY